MEWLLDHGVNIEDIYHSMYVVIRVLRNNRYNDGKILNS